MPQGNNEKVQTYALNTLLYVSLDVTTNIIRRLNALTGDMTARLKSIIVSAGSSN